MFLSASKYTKEQAKKKLVTPFFLFITIVLLHCIFLLSCWYQVMFMYHFMQIFLLS